VQFAVGDVVVYSAYGLGRVVARRQRLVLGVEQEVVVLEFDDGLTVSLPLERAREQLRALASETEIGRVQETLRQRGAVGKEPWLSRQRQARAKLTGGEPLGLAEIVRDGAARQRSLSAKGTKPELSEGERRVFLKARQLLSTEIGHVRGLGTIEADHWIDQQLACA
jgi:CarD family transcriptional regulator